MHSTVHKIIGTFSIQERR